MRFRVIYHASGRGLANDAVLVADVLHAAGLDCEVIERPPGPAGNSTAPSTFEHRFHQVLGRGVSRWWVGSQLGWRRRGRGADLGNIFLQQPVAELLYSARVNLLIPNQEWFHPRRVHLRGAFDRVLCKTRDAERIFSNLGFATEFIGFTSVDRVDTSVPRQANRFLHLAGNNQLRGTEVLIRVWSAHPEWPVLNVVQAPGHRPSVVPANVEYLPFPLSESDLAGQLNRADYLVFPSEAEGFGHSLVEAMSCGAVPIATDGPPMNELVTAERGLLVPAAPVGQVRLGIRYAVMADGLERQIARALALPAAERERLRANARAWYVANDSAFRERLAGVLRKF